MEDWPTPVNPWWLQLLKRQKLTFLPKPRFGTESSEVRILSPRPKSLAKLKKGPLSGWSFSVCDVDCDVTRRKTILSLEDSWHA